MIGTHCIENKLIISNECLGELFNEYYGKFAEVMNKDSYIKDILNKENYIEYHDFLYAIEGIDNNFEVMPILLKHKTNGRICFVRFNGPDDASLFGYEFSNGNYIKLIGYVNYCSIGGGSI